MVFRFFVIIEFFGNPPLNTLPAPTTLLLSNTVPLKMIEFAPNQTLSPIITSEV